MSTPIEFKDLRVGMTVECVWSPGHRVTGVIAEVDDGVVYSGPLDAHLIGSETDTFTLLDRPKPAVELPTVPSLGWASFSVVMPGLPETELGVWERRTFDNGNDTFRSVVAHNVSQAESVTAFTPATAVPTEALDKLWTLRRTPARSPYLGEYVDAFLAAVAAANGSSK